ncbi:Uncharacterized protein PECH_000853 [Penicillium ucsense]|uniref:RING-type domain-containing protein n=1 Tax=Penicillium ucsense TaxID=2839758 RepID=A0A8J8VYK5_9EURO|nr:Uncharacterized protein PECM_002043 [Penicillium ucsense]KAF7733298.1 Uncharacterized protein PECH_000853 [Penicillium ucsense]
MSQTQPPPALNDLEKELGCSICTELLYQPLTLLDCLHTFCGSCLKEWFAAQGSRRRSSPDTSPRFTCPSCRAEVLRTRTNATVTTLLDMVLKAHPDRARSEAEKEEIATRYTPGDSVFPSQRNPPGSEEDEADQRLLQQVQEMSVRESRSHARREARRAAGHSGRNREGSSHRERSGDETRTRRRRGGESGHSHDENNHGRRIQHQSSLRSIISLTAEAEAMQEQIIRQILDQGFLDDVDFDTLTAAQEEELSERIADAYRRGQLQYPRYPEDSSPRRSAEDGEHARSRSQSVQRPSENTTTSNSTITTMAAVASTAPSPSPSARDSADRRPPATRPHLFDPPTSRPRSNRQRRNSEHAESRRRASPVRVHEASNSEDNLRPAVRSSSDMTAERIHSAHATRARAEAPGLRSRRATDSEHGISDDLVSGGRERNASSSTNISQPEMVLVSTQDSPAGEHLAPLVSSPRVPPRSERRPRSSLWNAQAPSGAQYLEPSISCDRCGTSEIQYDVHKKCSKCKDPSFHLCLRCYRTDGDYPYGDSSRVSGFDPAAKAMYERIQASPNHRPARMRQTGHIMRAFKYDRPSESAQVVINGERKITNDNPALRLISGLFCDICQSPANDCFWKCSRCNEGDWGFCNRCVNQGRCCTHPLLPLRRVVGAPKASATSTPADSNTLSRSNTEVFKTLSFSTNCDICTYPIPASVTRFHCLKCNEGDYDVCTNCYLKLVATSKISKENGHNGWRRCLSFHRMIVVGFEDRDDGQRRVIVRDRVGGNALQEEHIAAQSPPTSSAGSSPVASADRTNGYWSWKEGSERRKKASRLRGSFSHLSGGGNAGHSHAQPSSTPDSSSGNNSPSLQHGVRRFPPDGGVGLVVQARWSYFPGEEDEDELFFPRGAEIKEVDDVNDEWFWGSYAGRTGLFPGTHVTVVGEIK